MGKIIKLSASKVKVLLNPYAGLPKEVYIIFLSRIVNAMGCFIMPLLVLILTDKVGLSSSKAGVYVTISSLVFMPASLIGGKLADTIGRKRVIIAFDGIAAVLYMSCGFMTPDLKMIAVLTCATFFMVMAGPAHDSLIADLTTPENRGNAYALTYMGWNIGFAVGPALGGFLYKRYLPLVFIGDAFTSVAAMLLILIFIKETIHLTKNDPEDVSRKLEKRESGSIISVILRRPILLYFAVCVFGYNFVYSQWSFMMPMHVKQNYAASFSTYWGWIASFNGVVVMVCTPFVTKYSQRIHQIRKMVYGGITYAIGFGMLAVFNTLPFFFVSVFIFTLGEIILSISVTPFIINHTPISHRGRMSAVMPMLMGMGYTISPITMGFILGKVNIETGWVIVALIAVAACCAMSRLEVYEKKNSLKDHEEGLQEKEINPLEAKRNEEYEQIKSNVEDAS